MIINFQGFNHFVDGINNQDCAIETERMALVLDGCSGAKHAEVGTGLFAQLFARKEGYDKLEDFEFNIKETFEEILGLVRPYYNGESLETKFIMENMLFTIIALFDCGDEYVVKLFGDGYIVTQNFMDCISYIRFSYGSFPPYYAYKYCKNMNFENHTFKTYVFKKSVFKKVFIGSDGIMPVVKGEIDHFDQYLKGNYRAIPAIIRSNRQKFNDDVTIAKIGV